DDNSGDGPQTKFDIGAGGNIFCASKTAGIYCDGATSVLCDDAGQVEDTTNCTPDLCIEGEGCVVCVDGQFACHGPRVMSCDTVGAASWQEVELCDPSINEVCDVGLGTCTALAPIGGTEPTGVYYRYALYTPTEGFTQISDVDSYGNRIYFIAMQGGTLVLGSYDVELLDTDGDGQFEPNQHPDNPDETGPVEERAFTFVEAVPITVGGAFPNVMELYATETKVYYTGTDGLYEYDLATGTVVLTTTFPSWLAGGGFSGMSFLGYDDVNEIWYSGNEAARRVFQYDAASSSWGWSFEYPVLAGSHMDGLEVVTQPGTGIPFVYVSDMTSNFIGQYRLDPAQGWVQENLFSYIETTGALVEGFGYGALGHFWVGSLANTFHELGGGDLTDFIGPEG
ncbi:MAG: hypothetical protein JKY37_11430, partial [Nannocystaceae bacterium]|nr:hypothetical protein [Nannocystaceae bacterium]